MEDTYFIYAQHISMINIKKHTSGNRGHLSISPGCYPKENTRRRTRRAPRRHESVLCPLTTFVPPTTTTQKKKKWWHSFLEDAHRAEPCQAWPVSWRKCCLFNEISHTEKPVNGAFVGSTSKRIGQGDFDAVPGNSLKSGFEDDPRQDRADAARPSFF